MAWLAIVQSILLMEEILHHLGCIKLCKTCDIHHINWCRISSINSIWVKNNSPSSIIFPYVPFLKWGPVWSRISRQSMYWIFSYIWLILNVSMVNVGKYTITTLSVWASEVPFVRSIYRNQWGQSCLVAVFGPYHNVTKQQKTMAIADDWQQEHMNMLNM